MFSSLRWLSLLWGTHIWSAPTVICCLTDMGTRVILKLPEWLWSTDGWGLLPPRNDVPALLKVTAFHCGGLQPAGVQGKHYSGLVSCSDWVHVRNIHGMIRMIWMFLCEWINETTRRSTCTHAHIHREHTQDPGLSTWSMLIMASPDNSL